MIFFPLKETKLSIASLPLAKLAEVDNIFCFVLFCFCLILYSIIKVYVYIAFKPDFLFPMIVGKLCHARHASLLAAPTQIFETENQYS